MWSNIVFGSVLIGVALLMTFFQMRAARGLKVNRESTDQREFSYLHSRELKLTVFEMHERMPGMRTPGHPHRPLIIDMLQKGASAVSSG